MPTLLLATLASVAGAAAPLPVAESSVGFGWWNGFRGEDRSLVLGPSPQALALLLATGGSSDNLFWGISTWQVQGLAATSLGQVGGPGPAAQVSTRSDGFNVEGWAKVDGSAGAKSYFRITLDPLAPVALTAFPVQLQAVGSAQWSGGGWSPYGEAGLSVWLGAEEFYGDDALAARFSASGIGSSGSVLLAETVTLDLHPGYDQPWFELRSSVQCKSMAFGNNDDTHLAPTLGWSACLGSAGATVRLDQAAFDADPLRYGATQSFALADYARLEYSANVPVPEPQTALLWLAGLAGLTTRAMRRHAR